MMRTPLVQVPRYHGTDYRGTVVPTVPRYTVLAGTSLPACTYGTVDIGQAGTSWYVFIQVAKWCHGGLSDGH